MRARCIVRSCGRVVRMQSAARWRDQWTLEFQTRLRKHPTPRVMLAMRRARNKRIVYRHPRGGRITLGLVY